MVAVVASLGSDPRGTVTDVAHLAVNDEDVVVVDGHGSDAPAGRPDADASGGGTGESLVGEMQSGGVSAVGLSGVDGKLLLGDETGVQSVNVALLRTLLDDGYVPVVSGPALARAGGDEPVDVAATEVAAAVAGALAASRHGPETDVDLVLLADGHAGRGTVDTAEAFDALRGADADDHELAAIETALASGVDRVVIGDAARADPVIAARGGHGTHVVRGALP